MTILAELETTMKTLGKVIEQMVLHAVDVITDGDWFEEMVERKAKEVLEKGDYQCQRCQGLQKEKNPTSK